MHENNKQTFCFIFALMSLTFMLFAGCTNADIEKENVKKDDVVQVSKTVVLLPTPIPVSNSEQSEQKISLVEKDSTTAPAQDDEPQDNLVQSLSSPSRVVYRGLSSYSPTLLFEVTYDNQHWLRITNKPILVSHSNSECRLLLREGTGDRKYLGPVQINGTTWTLRQDFPDRLVYDNEFLYYVFAVELPSAYVEGEPTDCQNQAEAVLATFQVVEDTP